MQKIPINWPGFSWQGGQQQIGDFIELLSHDVNQAVARLMEGERNADVE